MQQLPAALAPLAAYRQFLCYALVPSSTKPGKFEKIPVSPHTGQLGVSAHDPQHWTTAEHACAVASAWGEGFGVAYSFQTNDPWFFVDIDNAWNGQEWSATAQAILAMFPGAAVEVSQSGTGLHIIGRGAAPAHGKKNTPLGLEFYTELRFVALTGTHAQGNADTDHTAALYALTAQYFPPKTTGGTDGLELSAEPVAEWRGPTDDDELLRRALQSRSAGSVFGTRASFADLWEANEEVLAAAYPGTPYGASEADAALAAHLAFWTGRHGERIEALMRRSKLVRDKWDRDDYLPRTINSVLAHAGDVLQDKPIAPPPGAAPLTPEAAPAPAQGEAIEGQTFLSGPQQLELFRGCVYVQDQHKVLVPGGFLLKPDQFRVAYGGYTFALDTVNQRFSRNAWEAFTESQALRFPRADTMCFKPDQPPGDIIVTAGRRRANVWWPAQVRRTPGDAGPFLRHLAKLLPDERDRTILLSYMAGCVQYAGRKFMWAPVIQGAEGNGKTLLSACVAYAVGQHYTHWIKAEDLLSPFNGWIAKRLFIAVEELCPKDHRAQDDVIAALYPLISGAFGIQVQFKGVDQDSFEICANFMATTNHRGAVRRTPDNARRFANFYTAQQTALDIELHGMGGDYFKRLVGWLTTQDGFAIVAEYLASYPIPAEFDPSNLTRAPRTSTTDASIEESRGSVEQHVVEWVGQGIPGFMGGWVSSIQLDAKLTEIHKAGQIPPNKRRELMQSLGYILHPKLEGGRVNNPVAPDGRRPLLYIRADSPAVHLSTPAEVAKAYTAAQQPATAGVF